MLLKYSSRYAYVLSNFLRGIMMQEQLARCLARLYHFTIQGFILTCIILLNSEDLLF